MARQLLLLTMLIASPVYATDKVECLARIAYAEARGESLEGLTVLMYSALNHAKRSGKKVCAIPAKQQRIPSDLKGAYVVLAKGVLSEAIKDTSRGSDSWRSTKQPPKIGEITRKIQNHWFVSVLNNTYP